MHIRSIGSCGAGVLLAIGLTGCSAEAPAPEETTPLPSDTTALNERLQQLDSDLSPGSHGEEVRALHHYLTQFGYFPNDSLMKKYARWRPIVATAPADPAVFDDATTEAVHQLQRNMGLSPTGVVDADTRAILKAPRCGVPDGIQPLDPSEKFALKAAWGSRNLTWNRSGGFLGYPPGLSSGVVATQIDQAAWQYRTSTNIDLAGPLGNPHINIQFALIDGPGNILGSTFYPADGGDMTLDWQENWSRASPPPQGTVDLQTVVLHELGHALGLDHSSFCNATMFPALTHPNCLIKQAFDRTLDIDDEIAISALYDTPQPLPGCAKDIGVAGLSVWVVGCIPSGNGFSIHKWNGNNWDFDTTSSIVGAVHITVNGPDLRPWIVNSAGQIFRRTSNDPSSGGWEQLPGCAKDIAGSNTGDVWAIGCIAFPGGFSIHKWNVLTNNWDFDTAGGGATRIDVGRMGIPWLVNGGGQIFRKTSNMPNVGTWQFIPGSAQDIGVRAQGSTESVGNYAVVAGTDGRIYTWHEQAGTAGAPTVSGHWVQILSATNVTNLDMGPGGNPWYVQSNGNIGWVLD